MAKKKTVSKIAKGVSSKKKSPSGKKKKAESKKPSSYLAATTKSIAPKKRLASIRAGTSELLGTDANMERAFDILRDSSETVEVRLAALRSLQAASFSAVQFEGYRVGYTAVLREVASDENEVLRQRVLGLLCREKDPYAEKLLLDGFKSPEKALVHPAKALQLLSYNVHAGAFKIAKEMVAKSTDAEVRVEALRLLSADASAVQLIERCLKNKNEDPLVRETAATALHALKPEKLQDMARDIVLDDNEASDLQSMCLTALTSFGNYEAVSQDATLKASVNKMDTSTKRKPKDMKAVSAAKFVEKYGK